MGERLPARGSGSPPRARGRLPLLGHAVDRARFTPACAGTTPRCVCGSGWPAVHPRVRGDDAGRMLCSQLSRGSPPRARGRRADARPLPDGRRFTPACAGTTRPCPPRTIALPVHPRVRGDDGTTGHVRTWGVGSPPRARGRRRRPAHPTRAPRFTPACAGTTPRRRTAATRTSVHPRVRGDDSAARTTPGRGRGSPPRARGRRRALGCHRPVLRFTPACAGTTGPQVDRAERFSVHPRVRGDDKARVASEGAPHGSPPCARGRRRSTWCGRGSQRFTPACAGTTRALSPSSPRP